MTIAALNLAAKDRCFEGGEDGPMHVGRRIKKLMLAKGISTEKAAFHCGVTPGAVSNWFATGHITRDNLVVIADVLGESVRYLITGDERDRALSEIEAEFGRRDVPDGTRDAVLTLIRACPMRQAAAPEQAQQGEGGSDAEHFRSAIRPIEAPPASGSGRKREDK